MPSTASCPLCGSKGPLKKCDYDHMVKDTIPDVVNKECKKVIGLAIKKIRRANKGRLTPSEEKVVNILSNYMKSLK